MRVGLIGCGYWGSKIRRALEDLDHEVLVADPAIEGSWTPAGACMRSEVVVISTPPQWHTRHCLLASEYRTPFLVEKPFTLNPVDAAQIRLLSDGRGAVGHIALHATGLPDGFEKLRVHRATDSAGRHGIPAWWDLATHDIAVAQHFHGRPHHVELRQGDDWYEATLHWPDAIAELTGTRTGGKEWMFDFDGQPWSPYDSTVEPLTAELEWFLNGGRNLDEALDVVRTLAL
jgi:predicted dehydrogenase